MKNRKRALKLLRNGVVLALLAFLVWFGSGFGPWSAGRGLERLRQRCMLEELEVLGRGFGNEYVCAADGELALVFFNAGSDECHLVNFFGREEGVTVFPAWMSSWPRGTGAGLYAVGEVPGAEWLEAEVLLYEDAAGLNDHVFRPWRESYTVRCAAGAVFTAIPLEKKYLPSADGPSAGELYWLSAAEDSCFGDLVSAAGGAASNSPYCWVTLRYYDGDGALLAQYRRTVVQPVSALRCPYRVGASG